MSYELLVGLQIIDDVKYSQYRASMKPLLDQVNGGFRYDFKTSEVLKNEEMKPINRVFIIHFPDRNAKDCFFNDPKYLEIKQTYFEESVGATTIISEYERN